MRLGWLTSINDSGVGIKIFQIRVVWDHELLIAGIDTVLVVNEGPWGSLGNLDL